MYTGTRTLCRGDVLVMVNTTSPLCRKWMLLFLLVSISSGLCATRSESNREERPYVSHLKANENFDVCGRCVLAQGLSQLKQKCPPVVPLHELLFDRFHDHGHEHDQAHLARPRRQLLSHTTKSKAHQGVPRGSLVVRGVPELCRGNAPSPTARGA